MKSWIFTFSIEYFVFRVFCFTHNDCWRNAPKVRSMYIFGTYGLWAGRDLYRATQQSKDSENLIEVNI